MAWHVFLIWSICIIFLNKVSAFSQDKAEVVSFLLDLGFVGYI